MVCPSCTLYKYTDYEVVGHGNIDLSVTELDDSLRYEGLTGGIDRGVYRWDTGRWSIAAYDSSGGCRHELVVDATIFKGENTLRSLSHVFFVNGDLASMRHFTDGTAAFDDLKHEMARLKKYASYRPRRGRGRYASLTDPIEVPVEIDHFVLGLLEAIEAETDVDGSILIKNVLYGGLPQLLDALGSHDRSLAKHYWICLKNVLPKEACPGLRSWSPPRLQA